MRFAAWTRRRVAGGALLGHPKGPGFGMVRVRLSQPLESLDAVLAGVARRSPPHLRESRCVDVKRLVTDGGEHGCVARLISDGGLERRIGVIAGAVSSIQLEGFCARPEAGAAFAADFEALVRSCATGDTPLRARLFEYRPPPSWRGLRRSLSTLWLPPGCPRDRSAIEVFDAVPIGDRGAALIADLLDGAAGQGGEALAVGELTGRRFEEPERLTARLQDDRFSYQVRLDHRGERVHQLAFESLLRSIRPIPRPARRDVEPLLEWAL